MRLRLLVCLLLIHAGAAAQTLFTYGKYTVSKLEFLKAYSKNNSAMNSDSSLNLSYSDYLNLYARFRIKVQAALDEKTDTLAAQRSELQAFRYQLSESFLKEDASIKLLVDEAMLRSLKDIHVTDLFIPTPSGSTPEQINTAKVKTDSIYRVLKNGRPLADAATDYAVLDLGFVTVFVLPYKLENIIYTTPLGNYAAPFQTSSGFHILHPDKDRKAVGKIRIAQVLLSFPPDADEPVKKQIALRADSVYQALKNGADFSALALKLSNDNISYPAGGQMPAFGVGAFDPVFEKTAFDLAKDGDISKPVHTSFGYHILSRMQRIPVVEDVQNKEWITSIKEQVAQSDRMQVAQIHLMENVRRTISKDEPGIATGSDSAVLEYYRNHLEKYNPEFAEQLKEFKEGNLLFTIMQKNVWDAASSDSVALLQYFKQHKEKYYWESSADALLITSQSKKDISEGQAAIKQLFPVWRKWSEQSNGLIQADSGRFELSQIPVAGRTNFTEGLATAPVTSSQDSSTAFAYIVKLYPNREEKQFAEAKGAVISDYQVFLENQWMDKLQKKYPVKIRKKVFNSLSE